MYDSEQWRKQSVSHRRYEGLPERRKNDTPWSSICSTRSNVSRGLMTDREIKKSHHAVVRRLTLMGLKTLSSRLNLIQLPNSPNKLKSHYDTMLGLRRPWLSNFSYLASDCNKISPPLLHFPLCGTQRTLRLKFRTLQSSFRSTGGDRPIWHCLARVGKD